MIELFFKQASVLLKSTLTSYIHVMIQGGMVLLGEKALQAEMVLLWEMVVQGGNGGSGGKW